MRYVLLISALLLGVSIGASGLTGCASTRPAATKTVRSLDALTATLESGRGQLYDLAATLTEPLEHGGVDAKWFKRFANARADVADLDADLADELDAFRERRSEYTERWELDLARINDAELRKLARERRARLKVRLDAIGDDLAEAAEQLQPLRKQVDDLHIVLGNDLTREALAGVEGRLGDAAEASARIGDRLDDLAGDTAALAGDL